MPTPDASAPAGGAQTLSFKAEIRQLLDILVHSLYTEREIFLRELISNASDAINRLRFELLTNREVLDPEAELEIRITVDAEKKTITVSDTGIGMRREDVIENLGTIAHSGARAFIDAARQGGQKMDEMIGQFGVGFYSVFMVAEQVRVTSRSYQPEAEAVCWTATGADEYTLEAAEKAQRGTEIEIKLKEDAAEFADEYRLREIIRKHSDFIAFPIYIGAETEQVNQQKALWREQPRQVTEEQYNDFYKQITLDFEKPLKAIHIVTDAPVQLYAVLYLPAKAERGVFSLRKEDGLKLYARKVLIQDPTRDLLPEYLRFVVGVVDSEDLPLNVSRESVQSNAVMARIKKVLTGRVLSTLKEMALKESETYAKFWAEFGLLVKEGIATSREAADREALYPLLRFRTTRFADQWSGLTDYVGRMKAGQKAIYFLLGDEPRSAAASPHLDYFQRHGYEVLVLTDPIDSFMLLGLNEFEGYKLQNVAAADLQLPEADAEAPEPTGEQTAPETDQSDLIAAIKTVLGERITDVRPSRVLTGSVARLVDPEGSLNQEMQRVYRMVDKNYTIPKKVLEYNPRHPLIQRLAGLPAGHAVAQAVIEQIYESALLQEGLHPDPSSMIGRIQKLMEAALDL